MQSASDIPLWLRLWHWVSAVLFLMLVLTGVVLTFSTSEFALIDYGWSNTVHDVAGIALAIGYGLFLLVAFRTGLWRRYVRRCRGLGGKLKSQCVAAVTATRIVPGENSSRPLPFQVWQPFIFSLQKLMYLLLLGIVLPLVIVTGLAYLYPEFWPGEVQGVAGLWTIALTHYLIGLLGTVFILFHISICTLSGFRRMILGR